MSCDDDTAPTSGHLFIVQVADGKPSLLVGILQDIGVLVLSDATEEDDRVGWEEVLFRTRVVSDA